MSRGSCHMLRALQTPVLVPEPHRKAVLSPLAGKQSKASTEIGTQMHLTQNFAPCTDLSAGGKTYFSSVLALGKRQAMGGQSRPSRDRARVASGRRGAEARLLQAGQGAGRTVCAESHRKAREGGQRRSVLRAPRLPWGCHPPLPVSLPIVQHQEQTHHPGLCRCPGQFCASPSHPEGHLVKKIFQGKFLPCHC